MEALRVNGHLRAEPVHQVGRCLVSVEATVLSSLSSCFTLSRVSRWLLALPRHFIEIKERSHGLLHVLVLSVTVASISH
jgi:hypothetical protein